MAPSLPAGSGARRNFFLRAICASDALSLLLPSLGDWNPRCSTLNRGAATREDTGGTRLGRPAPLGLPGLVPRRDPRAAGAGGTIRRRCRTSGLSARLLFSGSVETRPHTQATALRRAFGIGSAAAPAPLPPGSSPCATGTSEVKEEFSSVENLHPITLSRAPSAPAACRLPPCHGPCPRRAPRRSRPPSQRFPQLHAKARTPSMHPTPPRPGPPSRPVGPPGAVLTPAGTCVASVGTRSPSHPPPSSTLASPLLGVPCHLCKYLCPLLCPRCPGWGEAGCRTLPLSPLLGAAPVTPPTPRGCLAAPQGRAVFGAGLSPHPPSPPTQRAPGGDRDTGTGAVK